MTVLFKGCANGIREVLQKWDAGVRKDLLAFCLAEELSQAHRKQDTPVAGGIFGFVAKILDGTDQEKAVPLEFPGDAVGLAATRKLADAEKERPGVPPQLRLPEVGRN